MTPLARRLYPLAVLLSGFIAAAVVIFAAERSRATDRSVVDRRTLSLVASAVAARTDGVVSAVRGPATAFDLGSLDPREITGVLRLAYAQNPSVTAVTLLDQTGAAIVPAAFLSRAGAAGAMGRPTETLDDLDRFAHEIPFEMAISHTRAIRGPYASAHGDGTRLAVAEAIPISEGTRTWILATEIDAAHLLDGFEHGVPDGDVFLIGTNVILGALATLPNEARVAARARVAHPPREPEIVAGDDWHLAIVRAPSGLDGMVAIAWSGDRDALRRARLGVFALGVMVISIVGALAAALAVALREVPLPKEDPKTIARSGRDLQVLGAVVKELANPIAATTAAAQLLANEPGRSRIADTMHRSAMRVDRVFRRVVRLARSGQEIPRNTVDLVSIVRSESDAMRVDIEQGAIKLVVTLPSVEVKIRGDEGDVALMVQVLLDAARSVTTGASEVHVSVLVPSSATTVVELIVGDEGAIKAKERIALMQLAEGTRVESAAPALAWALAARIAGDHGAEIDAREGKASVTEIVVRFEPV